SATEYIRELLLRKKEEGCGIILVSEDLEEILNLSDRVIVLFDGRISGAFIPGEVKIEEIGLMMTRAG
ncbi:MAG: heme ABC transporter ATP-binding protein, partial [Exilispira sp.]